jgi:WD40 repeat protein
MPENLSEAAPQVSHPHPVIAMAASPWAPLVAVSGHEAVLLYNTDTQEYLGALPFPERTPHVLNFSRDGKLLLAAGGRGAHSGKVVVWDVVKGERVTELGDDEIDSILAADISADRKYIATGGTDKVLKIYSVETGELLHRIKKHTDWVTTVSFSPDGKVVASGDRNGGVHTWEAEVGSILFTLAEHKKRVTDLAWRLDGQALASVGEEGKLVLWGMEEGFASRVATPHKIDPKKAKPGLRIKVDKGDSPGVLSIDYGKKGELVSAGRDGAVRIMRSDTREESRIEEFEDLPTNAVFTHDGARLVTGDFLGNVRFWDIVREKGKVKIEPLKALSTKVALSE